MRYPHPLVEARFVRRYKRFFVDVRMADGTIVTAHCANTGAMTGCTAPDAPVRLSRAANPKRKLRWSLEQIQVGGHWILAHTARPNTIVAEALHAGQIPSLRGYTSIERERRLGESRIDFRLHGPEQPPTWVEVKNVTLLEADGVLRFPDAITARGRRHLDELASRARLGERAMLLLHVGHSGGERVGPARHVDPAWGQALDAALSAGVEVEAWRVEMNTEEATLASPVSFSPD